MGSLLIVLSLATLAGAPSAGVHEAQAQSVVATLQDVFHDYGEADALAHADRFDVFAKRLADARVLARDSGGKLGGMTWRLEQLERAILRREPAGAVEGRAAALIRRIVQAERLPHAPTAPPDLGHGKQLYAVACASCHGADGFARTPLAATLTPPPASFQDADDMSRVTPYQLANVIRFGVPDTAMPSYDESLPAAERWEIAFYVMSLRFPACTQPPPPASLEELATTSDRDLALARGPENTSCLRHPPDALTLAVRAMRL